MTQRRDRPGSPKPNGPVIGDPGPAFGIGSIKGSNSQVDYRLARRALISEYRRGRISINDICDGHPELIRAARNVGEPTSIECPVCAKVNVVLVSFVFGPRLGPSGRCVTSRAEFMALRERSPEPLTTYVVEACPECSWNHLTRTFVSTPIVPKMARVQKRLG